MRIFIGFYIPTYFLAHQSSQAHFQNINARSYHSP